MILILMFSLSSSPSSFSKINKIKFKKIYFLILMFLLYLFLVRREGNSEQNPFSQYHWTSEETERRDVPLGILRDLH